ncbi:MAG: succinate dehydrogenase, cytochrome b556 subunit [Proteobacteria bacterium]|nr:succinate dehydrogenase, cytochrome b556 subunit [Pseudomonadota bacterium]
MTDRNRPLSPHLQIYRPQITSILSITHRMTGIALVFGAVMLVYWLMAATYGPAPFATAQAVMGSWIGKIVLAGVIFSLWYHLANGIRHLAWDIGLGFELDQVRNSGLAVVAISVALTALTIAVIAGGV